MIWFIKSALYLDMCVDGTYAGKKDKIIKEGFKLGCGDNYFLNY